MQPTPSQLHHWRKTRLLTLVLLAVWALVTFGASFVARELDFRFWGWPFGYWVAAQGALVVFVGLVAIYAFAMDRLDWAHALDEDEG